MKSWMRYEYFRRTFVKSCEYDIDESIHAGGMNTFVDIFVESIHTGSFSSTQLSRDQVKRSLKLLTGMIIYDRSSISGYLRTVSLDTLEPIDWNFRIPWSLDSIGNGISNAIASAIQAGT